MKSHTILNYDTNEVDLEMRTKMNHIIVLPEMWQLSESFAI